MVPAPFPVRFGAALLALALFALPRPSTAGTLPAAVEGQPLPTLAPMLERVMPAVVNINSRQRVKVRDPFANDPFFRQFFGMPDAPRERIEQSLGSGVIIDAAKGYVLTNNHVIGGAEEIRVTLHDGRTVNAERVGVDPDTDVALIRIPAQGLTALPLADSTRLRVGDFVVAVGNPFGVGQSAAGGMVSGIGRSGLRGLGYQNFIQTDASINPGNSGGALVNLRGELVGINTMILSPSGGNVGLGFAIPASMAQDVIRQLLAYGQVKRGSLGAQTQALTAELARSLGLSTERGAVVTRVLRDSPAARAGLQPGDVVTGINGRAVNNPRDLANAEGLLPVGEPVELEVLREGRTLRIASSLSEQARGDADGARLEPRLAGARFVEVPAAAAQRGYHGVVVEQVAEGSAAAANGLRRNDVITAVNQRDVADLAEFRQALKQRSEQVLLTVLRGRGAFYLLLE